MDKELGTLVKGLFSEECVERQNAGQKLVKIGREVIPFLIGLQYSNNRLISWEAIKTLSEIAHPDAIPIFINGLENDDPNIRWMAAEGLIKIDQPSVKPVLRALEMRGGSKSLRETVYHVLRSLRGKSIFIDDYDLIGMLKNLSRQTLVAPTAAIIHLKT